MKKNIIIIILSSITLFLGFLTFLTFIDRSFVDLNEKNLQYLLISNIFLLILLFIFIFVEVKNSIKIDIDKDFTAKFIKAKNALPDSENFGVACKNGKLDIIINYSSINTNRIKFSFDCNSDECTDLTTVCFSSNLFKEILQANKDADSGTLEISSAGLARAIFTSKSYTSTYYLVQLQTA